MRETKRAWRTQALVLERSQDDTRGETAGLDD